MLHACPWGFPPRPWSEHQGAPRQMFYFFYYWEPFSSLKSDIAELNLKVIYLISTNVLLYKRKCISVSTVTSFGHHGFLCLHLWCPVCAHWACTWLGSVCSLSLQGERHSATAIGPDHILIYFFPLFYIGFFTLCFNAVSSDWCLESSLVVSLVRVGLGGIS